MSKCLEAQPRYGDVWQAIAKDPANAHVGTEKLLLLVADKLAQEKGTG